MAATTLPYGQDTMLSASPERIAAWITSTPVAARAEVLSRLRKATVGGQAYSRTDVETWVRDCTRYPAVPANGGSGSGVPSRSDSYKPPQVGAKDHQTVAARLQYQARGLHIPYVRSAAYGQQVPASRWTRAALRAHDDPYAVTSGNGMIINQDGLWTITVKTDWSVGHAEVVVGSSQATRLMVNGSDVGLRDYLDDDAYSAKIPINTFTWTDTFRAGTRLNVDIRSEGLGENFVAVANVYLRAHLVRCFDDAGMDMQPFPLPPDPSPKPDPVPNPPVGGAPPTVPSAPVTPQKPNNCGGADFSNSFVVNENGQVGYYRCIDGQVQIVWSSYNNRGQSGYGGGVVGGGGAVWGSGGSTTSDRSSYVSARW